MTFILKIQSLSDITKQIWSDFQFQIQPRPDLQSNQILCSCTKFERNPSKTFHRQLKVKNWFGRFSDLYIKAMVTISCAANKYIDKNLLMHKNLNKIPASYALTDLSHYTARSLAMARSTSPPQLCSRSPATQRPRCHRSSNTNHVSLQYCSKIWGQVLQKS